jgi:hypothetical protein
MKRLGTLAIVASLAILVWGCGDETKSSKKNADTKSPATIEKGHEGGAVEPETGRPGSRPGAKP